MQTKEARVRKEKIVLAIVSKVNNGRSACLFYSPLTS